MSLAPTSKSRLKVKRAKAHAGNQRGPSLLGCVRISPCCRACCGRFPLDIGQEKALNTAFYRVKQSLLYGLARKLFFVDRDYAPGIRKRLSTLRSAAFPDETCFSTFFAPAPNRKGRGYALMRSVLAFITASRMAMRARITFLKASPVGISSRLAICSGL